MIGVWGDRGQTDATMARFIVSVEFLFEDAFPLTARGALVKL